MCIHSTQWVTFIFSLWVCDCLKASLRIWLWEWGRLETLLRLRSSNQLPKVFVPTICSPSAVSQSWHQPSPTNSDMLSLSLSMTSSLPHVRPEHWIRTGSSLPAHGLPISHHVIGTVEIPSCHVLSHLWERQQKRLLLAINRKQRWHCHLLISFCFPSWCSKPDFYFFCGTQKEKPYFISLFIYKAQLKTSLILTRNGGRHRIV